MKNIPALAMLVLAAGCHTLATPPNFMPVERGDLGAYDQRTVSANGVVIGLRSQRAESPERWNSGPRPSPEN